jgi:hypothetical protein
MTIRLAELPRPLKVASGGFVLLLCSAYLLGQVTLWAKDGDGALPGPDAVLAKYHGSPEGSRLHRVLAADVPPTSPRAMWLYLDPLGDADAIQARRETVLGWVEAGAPRDGWPAIQEVLHQQGTCLQCHAYGMEKQDLPLETYEQVLVVATKGGGIPLAPLLTSAHNHVFAFAVLAFLLSVLVALTRLPARLSLGLMVTAYAGAALDIGGWFLTRALGPPWQWAVIGGGALFGLAVGAMALVVLVDLLRPTGRGNPSG